VPEYLSLQTHYVRTLRTWADALEANRDQAIAVANEENYDRYMRYLRGCQNYFADEMLDCNLVTYLKPGAAA
jgi:cyclopropane-fatty-acyl-phospholipid synthase